jgi:hypothetical protein
LLALDEKNAKLVSLSDACHARPMRNLIFVLALACHSDTQRAADMTLMSYPLEGQPCGSDGGIDPKACGPGYVCMQVGSLAPVCLVLSGKGQSCGGFTTHPRQCEPGLTCKASGIPDTGGVCE